MPQNEEKLVLFTNNGSIYYCTSKDKKSFIYASERHILNSVIRKASGLFEQTNITNLLPNHILSISLNELIIESLSKEEAFTYLETNNFKNFIDVNQIKFSAQIKNYKNTSLDYNFNRVPEEFLNEFSTRTKEISLLRRCSKCILPETFPFISFDVDGVCNFCNNHVIKNLQEKMILLIMEKYMKKNNQT